MAAYGYKPKPKPKAADAYGQRPTGLSKLIALQKYMAPLTGYFDRQERIARDGLAMADQGAQQVRQGDMTGLAGMIQGPMQWAGSYPAALFPIEEAQTQLPKEVSPFVAGGLELAAMMMPGPKGGKAPKPKQWSAPQVREYGNLAATPEHVRDVLEERGLKVRSEENSNAEASLSKYIFADTEQGPFKVRISDHSYLAPEYGADIRYGYPRDEIEARISIGLGLAEPWRPPDPKAHLRGEAKQWAERLGMNPNTRDAMNAIVKALETGQPTRRMREWTAANTDQALANLTQAPEGITAYHGSPHTFDKFDMSKIGTGEGAQAYGHGLYFAESENVAKSYRDKLSKDTVSAGAQDISTGLHAGSPKGYVASALKSSKGDLAGAIAQLEDRAKSGLDFERLDYQEAARMLRETPERFGFKPATPSMYQVRLNVKPDELLDWDRPISQQPEAVRQALKGFANQDMPAVEAYVKVGQKLGQPHSASPLAADWMRRQGIKGIRYKDQGSRGFEGGTYNYVIFDDKLVEILKRYAIPFTLGVGGAAIVSGQDMPPEVASQLGPQA